MEKRGRMERKLLLLERGVKRRLPLFLPSFLPLSSRLSVRKSLFLSLFFFLSFSLFLSLFLTHTPPHTYISALSSSLHLLYSSLVLSFLVQCPLNPPVRLLT
jgi:hypothetical protein